MSALVFFTVVLGIGYCMLILAFWLGWELIPHFDWNRQELEAKTRFSILIPARNEANSILQCLEHIQRQHYPTDLFEIIVLDDHSTDSTYDVVTTWAINSGLDLRIIRMAEVPGEVRVKKAVIEYGVEQAKYPYILMTDADCWSKETWLRSIDAFVSKVDPVFVYAPVSFSNRTVFEIMQAMEFAGLVAIGGAAIRLKNPNLCSAANLLIRKDVFIEVGGYHGNIESASGDDVFLLHKVFKHYPDRIHFLKDYAAMVTTHANTSMQELIMQRKRWVSKNSSYNEKYILITMVWTYLFNLFLFISLLVQPTVGFIIFLAKMLVEGGFLFRVLGFYRQRRFLFFIPLAEVLHILYVIFIGIWANIGEFEWKGRKLQ